MGFGFRIVVRLQDFRFVMKLGVLILTFRAMCAIMVI